MFENSTVLNHRTAEPFIRQLRVAPSVYLDICALRNIAQDAAYADRFVNALLDKGGTLVLSGLSLSEFATLPDSKYQHAAGAVGALVQRIVPHLFMQHWFPEKVLVGEANREPYPDSDLDGFSTLMYFTDNLRGPLTIAHAFGDPNLLRALRQHVVSERQAALRRIKRHQTFADADAKSRARNMRKAARVLPRATLYLSWKLMKGAQDRDDVNDGFDYMHAVVPAAYCDFVVAEKHWWGQIRQATVSLRAAGGKAPIARAFRTGPGLPDFLRAIERWQPHQSPPAPGPLPANVRFLLGDTTTGAVLGTVGGPDGAATPTPRSRA